MAYALWRNGVEGYKIADKEWELVLDVSDKTARNIVNNTEGQIKISGKKYKMKKVNGDKSQIHIFQRKSVCKE